MTAVGFSKGLRGRPHSRCRLRTRCWIRKGTRRGPCSCSTVRPSVSIRRATGTPRELNGLYLYAGGELVAGETTVRPTVLTVPQITSYSSSVLFHPLELQIAEVVGIGAGSRIDVSERGLLGSTAEDNMTLAGETPAERDAGGSHGGSGWFGSSSSYWESSTLYHPSSSYGSVHDPRHRRGRWWRLGRPHMPAVPAEESSGLMSAEGLVHLAGIIHADGGDCVPAGPVPVARCWLRRGQSSNGNGLDRRQRRMPPSPIVVVEAEVVELRFCTASSAQASISTPRPNAIGGVQRE